MPQVWRSFSQSLCFCCHSVRFVHNKPGDLLRLSRQVKSKVQFCQNLCPCCATLWRSNNPDVIFAKLINITKSDSHKRSETNDGGDLTFMFKIFSWTRQKSGSRVTVLGSVRSKIFLTDSLPRTCRQLLEFDDYSLSYLTDKFLFFLRQWDQGGRFCHVLQRLHPPFFGSDYLSQV